MYVHCVCTILHQTHTHIHVVLSNTNLLHVTIPFVQELSSVRQQMEEARQSRDDAVQLVSMWESLASRAEEIPPVSNL